MQLEPENSSNLQIISIDNETVATSSCQQRLPCIIHNDEIKTLDCNTLAEISEKFISELAAYNTEIYLIGTGAKHLWPNKQQLAAMAKSNIACEFMPNDKASYTFNLLRSENRDVVLILLNS